MAVVLDAGPLIRGIVLSNLGSEFFTTESVLREVRDERARSQLALRLESITSTEPTDSALSQVVSFAKLTGDFSSLSETDLQVLALACRLHCERGGELRTQPGESRPFNNAARLDEWITPDNYKPPAETVSLVTFDFAVQNVAVQMGIRVKSADGLEIRYVKRWAKRCTACGEICEDTEKEFCPSCGNHALGKISYSVDEEGNRVYYEGRRKKNDLTGSVFPIPNPRGGKDKDDIILREDQLMLMGGRQHKWNWKKPQVFDKEAVEFFGFKVQAKSGFKYGPSRKNPNQPSKKSKKKM
jgi:rRNA maturation endonuclease Nob1